ncbi:MAG: hypothetical protein K5911_06620 [Eubacteriales bacterium]|nr:hypothetical protein [Eubacteriales bacterium]
MENSSMIFDYIKPPKAVRIIAWVLLAVGILGIVLSAGTFGKGDDRSSAVKFNNSAASAGDYCYIDVVGVSDWLYKYDSSTYYTVLDSDGNYGIALIKSSDYYSMSAQRTYWDSDDDAVAPEPYRLYGMSVTTTDTLKKNIAEVWGMSQVEYSSYFGRLYLNASASPSSNRGSLFIALAVFSLAGWFGTGLYSLISRSRAKKSVRNLEATGRMQEASSQFYNAVTNYPSEPPIVVTKDYIFTKNTGSVVDLSDIKWIFRRIQRYNFVKVGEYLIGKTADGKEKMLMTINKNSEPGIEDRIVDNIRAINPDLIVGYSKEAQAAYNEYRKAVKNGTAR